MDANTKWNSLKEYLKNQQATALTNIKRSAMGEQPNELRACGAQLAIVETILTYVERLDHEGDTPVGRHAPPKEKY